MSLGRIALALAAVSCALIAVARWLHRGESFELGSD